MELKLVQVQWDTGVRMRQIWSRKRKYLTGNLRSTVKLLAQMWMAEIQNIFKAFWRWHEKKTVLKWRREKAVLKLYNLISNQRRWMHSSTELIEEITGDLNVFGLHRLMVQCMPILTVWHFTCYTFMEFSEHIGSPPAEYDPAVLNPDGEILSDQMDITEHDLPGQHRHGEGTFRKQTTRNSYWIKWV